MSIPKRKSTLANKNSIKQGKCFGVSITNQSNSAKSEHTDFQSRITNPTFIYISECEFTFFYYSIVCGASQQLLQQGRTAKQL